ncbi:efflux RND transporter periplasmic adaptor subunit [Paenibacillus sp. OV219]|uniref:efflux RND transporter periplasmic adaptor subunit n=1 Tax=Paenibacillus sp. OV219 TaxID=1884377 RepID=UPI0008ADC0A7|nr:efflux RND transporter periplasmic adaptor subunit [Paenibacillus sp. OV219]SEP10657.1 RND family efflux transporter, MFP subunit [Paenibacillus sp. OV219]
MQTRRSRSRSHRGSLLRLTLAGTIAVSLLSGCSLLPAEEEALQPPILAKKEEVHDTAVVTRGNMELYLTSIATASSDTNNNVSFTESGGILKKLHVQEGDKVKKGDPIAEIDTGDLPLQIKLQKLTVEQRSLQYSDAVKNGADKDQIQFAKIDLEKEQLQLGSLEKRYAKALLLAPLDGIITYLNEMKPGEAVEAQRVMAVISNPSKVNFVYEATDVSKISAVKPGIEVALTFDDKTYKGKVIQTPASAPKSDVESIQRRNARALIIAMDAPKPQVQIGTMADIKLFIEKRDNVLVIPRDALQTMFGRNYIETIDNDRVKEVDVEVGLKTNDQVEIKQGITEGQKVIIDN